MFPGLSCSTVADRIINDVDINKDESIFDVSSLLSACVSSSNSACITVFPNNSRPKFGLRQPKIKIDGKKVTALCWSPIQPTLLCSGSEEGAIQLWNVPETGLKLDTSNSQSKFNSGNEVKCLSFNPLVEHMIAAGLRNGHILIFDQTLAAPLIVLENQRPLNSISWSYDGTLLYALYADMILRIWDVRAKNVVVERKICPTRGVGFVEALPEQRLLVSFVEKGKQELQLMNEKLEDLCTRSLESKASALAIKYHFTGLVIAQGSKCEKVFFLNSKDLKDEAVYQHGTPIIAISFEPTKPNPDENTVMVCTALCNGNIVMRLKIAVPQGSLPVFNDFPIINSKTEPASWLSGQNGAWCFEPLKPTPKVEEVVVKEEKVSRGPMTRYRYLSAEPDPPREIYSNLPVSSSANHEFNEITTNGKQFAFIGSGSPSPIYIMPVGKPFKFSGGYPYIADAHKNQTSYLSFSPHKSNHLISSGEDGKIKLWEIPEEMTHNINEPLLTLQMLKRVGVVKYSEAVNGLIAAASAQPELALWDLIKEEKCRNFSSNCSSQCQDLEFDSLSTMLFAIFKDGKLIGFDPRSHSGDVLSTTSHVGIKHRRLVHMADLGLLASFGSNKINERQCSIWDYRQFDKPLKTIEMDKSIGAIIPLYEEGSNILYCGAKGEGSIKFFEICNDDRVIASNGSYDTNDIQRGLCLTPRSSLNVMAVECSRMLKLCQDSLRTLHWRTPRTRTDVFQDDIFQPSRDIRNPLMTTNEWEDGASEVFPMIDLQPEGKAKFTEVAPSIAPKKAPLIFANEVKKDIREDKLSINVMVNAAPEISTSSEDESSDSW